MNQSLFLRPCKSPTTNTLTCASLTRQMTRAAGHLFQMEKGSVGAFRNTSHPCQAEIKSNFFNKLFISKLECLIVVCLYIPVAFAAGSTFVCLSLTRNTCVMTCNTLSLSCIQKCKENVRDYKVTSGVIFLL